MERLRLFIQLFLFENEIIGKRKNQTKYSVKILYTDERKKKIKKLAESYYKNYENLNKISSKTKEKFRKKS